MTAKRKCAPLLMVEGAIMAAIVILALSIAQQVLG